MPTPNQQSFAFNEFFEQINHEPGPVGIWMIGPKYSLKKRQREFDRSKSINIRKRYVQQIIPVPIRLFLKQSTDEELENEILNYIYNFEPIQPEILDYIHQFDDAVDASPRLNQMLINFIQTGFVDFSPLKHKELYLLLSVGLILPDKKGNFNAKNIESRNLIDIKIFTGKTKGSETRIDTEIREIKRLLLNFDITPYLKRQIWLRQCYGIPDYPLQLYYHESKSIEFLLFLNF